ncbi:MAG TPA: zinc-dependent metalloprotease [Edaphocola sp.]|nr:zinc-dependent metalloprotease [Edaphocola sp.]
MNSFILRLTIFCIIVSLAFSGNAQQFKPLNLIQKQKLSLNQQKKLDDYAHTLIFTQDTNEVKNFVRTISNNYNENNFKSEITLPNFQGQEINFILENSMTLSNDFQRDQVNIKSFRGISTNGDYTIRLTLSHMGVMGKLSEKVSGNSWYITPLDMHQPNTLIMFASDDAKVAENAHFNCETIEIPEVYKKTNLTLPPLIKIATFGDCQLRTYKLAVAATAEYTNWSGSQSNAIVNIANSVNNVNEVYERDLTIHFELYTKNDVIQTNSNTQPYSLNPGFSAQTLNENIIILNSVFTSSGYDLGILFHYGFGGGLAYVGAVCSSYKGGAAAGIGSSSQVSYFELSVMHEIGHLFSAGHTMSVQTGSCGGNNYTSTSSVEAGGGSSIMAYAGNCGVLSYQGVSDKYFHSFSITQMLNYISQNSCALISSTGNTPPISSVLNKSFNIPKLTPFKLSMTAISPNSNLSYAFDQMDLYGGTGASSLPSPTATFGPLFRTRVPTNDSFRYFPSISILLGEESGDFEVLTSVARAINFKGIVRDNHIGGGCKAQETTVVTTKNCGPFEFTNLTTATTLTANGSNTITLNWSTANACVPTTNVRISFSVDGGHNYPYIILNSTPNDGTETIIVPNLATCKGRFMIEALGNIHFNINKGPITIISSCQANGTKISSDANISYEKGSPNLNLSLSPLYGTVISQPISGNLTSADPNSFLVFLNTAANTCEISGNTVNYKIYEFYSNTTGNHNFSFTGAFGLLLNLYSGSFDPNNLCSGYLYSTAQRNGSIGPVTLNNSFNYSLCSKQKYTLVVSSFGPTNPILPGSYSINITGGSIFNNIPNPGPGYNYGYVIVDATSGLIKEISTNANLSDPIQYPGGNYLVYGLSTSSPLNSLNTSYSGNAFSSFSTAILNQIGGICAQLSTNLKKVAIMEPTPLNYIQLEGKITKGNSALLSWFYKENLISPFNLERSINGRDYVTIEKIDKRNRNQYQFEDQNFSTQNTSKVYYRLRNIMKNGEESFSNLAVLTPNKFKNATIEIFPNPIEDKLIQIQFKDAAPATYWLKMSDVLGKTIFNEKIEKGSGQLNHQIILNNSITPGVYYIHINSGEEHYSFKISKI